MGESQFDETSRELLDGFARWAGDPVDTGSARFALDYKREIHDPYPNHWVGEDIDELLFGFFPARVFLVDEEIDQALDGITRFLEFLDAEGRLAEGSDRVVDLVAHLEGHRRDFRETMEDPETGGHSKRLLLAMAEDAVDLRADEAVQLWMAEFDAGPIERREAILGPAPGSDDEIEPTVQLPPRPSVDEDVARASASDSPLLTKMVGLAEYMGDGRPLTATGNLKLADARALVDLFETGDTTDYEIAGRQHRFRTAAQLHWLDMVVWLARQVGAVKLRTNKMSATQAWLHRVEDDPLAEAEKIATILVSEGPITALLGDTAATFEPALVVDASAVSLLARLYEAPQPVDGLTEAMIETVPLLLELPDWYFNDSGNGTLLERFVSDDVEKMLRVMDWAGVLTWTGFRRETDRWGIFEDWRGGQVQITPFGTWLVQNSLSAEGLVSAPVLVPLTVRLDDPPHAIVEALAATLPAGPLALAEAWEELGGYDGLPDQLWRVDRPETAALLETLGKSLPDRSSAKAARKALLKHRSWMASRS